MLWSAYRGLNNEGRRELSAALDAPPGLDRRRTLLDLIHRSGAIAWCRSKLDIVRRDAGATLAEAPIDPAQRRQFVALTGLFGASTERSLELVNGYGSGAGAIEPVVAIVDNGVGAER